MKTKHIIFGLLIFVLLFLFIQNKEHAGSTSPPLSNEAIQNIAKVYSDTANTATFNNIQTTGKLNVDGSVNFLPVASIIMFAWPDNAIPDGWAKCDGGTYIIENKKAKKVAKGTQGGIDTPDLRGRFPLGIGAGPGLTQRSEWQNGGAESHTLTVNEMPKHTHNVQVPGYNNNGANTWESTQDRNTNGMYTRTTTETGQGQPHNNMPPFATVNFIMRII